MTVSININGLDPITEAINRLAIALGARGVAASLSSRSSDNPGGQQAPQNGAFGAAAGIQGGFQGAGNVPVAHPGAARTEWPGGMPQANGQTPPAPPAGPLPTTASPQAYTQDQIAVAMTGLVDQGKQPQIMQVLAQFGAGSLMQVPKEQYPALATQLRMLGAAI